MTSQSLGQSVHHALQHRAVEVRLNRVNARGDEVGGNGAADTAKRCAEPRQRDANRAAWSENVVGGLTHADKLVDQPLNVVLDLGDCCLNLGHDRWKFRQDLGRDRIGERLNLWQIGGDVADDLAEDRLEPVEHLGDGGEQGVANALLELADLVLDHGERTGEGASERFRRSRELLLDGDRGGNALGPLRDLNAELLGGGQVACVRLADESRGGLEVNVLGAGELHRRGVDLLSVGELVGELRRRGDRGARLVVGEGKVLPCGDHRVNALQVGVRCQLARLQDGDERGGGRLVIGCGLDGARAEGNDTGCGKPNACADLLEVGAKGARGRANRLERLAKESRLDADLLHRAGDLVATDELRVDLWVSHGQPPCCLSTILKIRCWNASSTKNRFDTFAVLATIFGKARSAACGIKE